MGTIRTTPVVRNILIATIAVFLVQMIGDSFLGLHILETLGLIPQSFIHRHQYWQIFTYMFVHADMFHILFNSLILWMVGSELEAQWGAKEFTKFYFLCGIAASLIYLLVQLLFFMDTAMSMVPMVGASGAIYGLLMAYGIIYSERQMLFMMIFPMKAKHFVLILAAIEFVSTVFYSKSGVANIAHLGGMVFGFSYLFLKAYLRVRKREISNKTKAVKRKKSHLRLVVNNDLLKEFDTDDGEDEKNDGPTNH